MTRWDYFISKLLFKGEDYDTPGYWRKKRFDWEDSLFTSFKTESDAIAKLSELYRKDSRCYKEVVIPCDDIKALEWVEDNEHYVDDL